MSLSGKVRRGRAAGLTTVLNPAPADSRFVDAGSLEQVDVLTPNAGEAAMLLGKPVDPTLSDDAVVEIALELQTLGVKTVVITRGSSGVLVVEESATHVPAVKAEAVDTTAAGDAFNGSLAV